MSTLDQVTKGLVKTPDLMVIYGPEGVGKSTFASKAPKVIFLDIEKGTKRLNVERYDKAKTFNDVNQFLTDLCEQKHDYSTLAVDSLSELERMIWNHVCTEEGCANIEQVGGGFSKGYIVALKQWEAFKTKVTRLQETKGMNIIMTTHSEVKTFTDPTTNSAYDRYQIKLDKRAHAFIREWVDFVGFANYKTSTKGKENAAKHKAYGDGTRRLYTERRPSWDAKNRLGLPLEMDFDYMVYSQAANASEEMKAQQIRDNINELIKDYKDENFVKLVHDTVAKAKENTTDLMLIQERLRAKLQKENDNGSATTNAA